MPTINVNDAYVLNETGAEVDKVTGLFTKNENATTGEKQMARLNIAAGGSNHNLLDNAYFVGGGSQLGDGHFPINQRGQTSYSANAYGIDRWICYGGTQTVWSGGVTIPANGVMTQPTNNLAQLNGKALTLSILYEDRLAIGTATLDLSGTTMFINNGAEGLAYITSGGLVQFYRDIANTIKAVKLELGTVSTLANDPAPDYGEELRKCQRYFTRLQTGIQHSIFGTGVVEAGNIVACAFELPTVMRVSGTASAVVNNLYGYDGSNTYTVSGVYAFRQSGATPIASVWCGVTATAGTWLQIRGNDGSAYIDISAEL